MLIPITWTPLSRENYIQRISPPPLSRVWLPLTITKNTLLPPPPPPFLVFSETTKIPPFPENMGTRMRPPYAFEWGGGGGGELTSVDGGNENGYPLIWGSWGGTGMKYYVNKVNAEIKVFTDLHFWSYLLLEFVLFISNLPTKLQSHRGHSYMPLNILYFERKKKIDMLPHCLTKVFDFVI